MPVELSPKVKIAGSPLTAEQISRLVAIEVDRGLNLIGRATLRFIESAYDLKVQPAFALGTAVAITGPDGTALFSGEVTGVSLDQDFAAQAAVTELTVTVDDLAYKMAKETQQRVLLNQTYSDVINSLVSGTGMSASVDSAGGSNAYLLQTTTNLAYLEWVAARCGQVWWVDGSTLNVKKVGTSTATVAATLGDNLLRVSTRTSGRHAGKVNVTGWDMKQQTAVTYAASATTSAESTVATGTPGRTSPSGAGITVLGTSSLTQDEATMVGDGLLAEATSAAVTTRGTTMLNAAIAPATTIDVKDAGPATGKYLVSRVRHTYDATGGYTHFTAGPIRPGGLVDLLGPSSTPELTGAVINGLVIGVVSNVDDSEGKLGRVKVTFPTLGSTIESEWARVVTIGGGASRGAVFVPEVKDEVLVGFEEGDTRRPVVIGGLFSDNNALPSTDNVASGKVAYRRITSRLGHIIELADGESDDKKHVLLKTKGGNLVRVGEDKLELTVTNKPVSISNGKAKIEFSDSGDITIEGVNVTIKASGSFKVEGTGGVELKSDASAKVQGNMVEVKGSASGTIDGGGMLTVKGGTVMIN